MSDGLEWHDFGTIGSCGGIQGAQTIFTPGRFIYGLDEGGKFYGFFWGVYSKDDPRNLDEDGYQKHSWNDTPNCIIDELQEAGIGEYDPKNEEIVRSILNQYHFCLDGDIHRVKSKKPLVPLPPLPPLLDDSLLNFGIF